MVKIYQTWWKHNDELSGFNTGSVCSTFYKIPLILLGKQRPVTIFYIRKHSIEIFLSLWTADIRYPALHIMKLAFHYKTMISSDYIFEEYS